MKVFISWSGERSHAVAKLLDGWIPCVIQEIKTWISSEDIEKGSIWFDDITDTLKETNVGIICLTPENKDKPWILFESGALLSGFTKSRVCPFLIDLTPTDITPPLSQFNHTVHAKTDMLKLLKSLNNQLDKKHILKEKILTNVFEKFWPEFDEKYKKILKTKPEKELVVQAKRDQESIMNEVLMLVRRLSENEQPHNPNNPGFLSDAPPVINNEAIYLAKRLLKRGKTPTAIIDILLERGIKPSDAIRFFKFAKINFDFEQESFDHLQKELEETSAPKA